MKRTLSLIMQRLPTTLFVLGTAQLLAILVAGTSARARCTLDDLLSPGKLGVGLGEVQISVGDTPGCSIVDAMRK